MTCSSAEAAKARALLKIPSWRYHFVNNKSGNLTDGAKHGDEVPHVFGVAKFIDKPLATKVLMPAWAAFAKDPVNGLSNLGWPKYDPTGKLSNTNQ